MDMDLKTRIEVLPCGKCEDMLDCDTCIFSKEAKELYKQIRAEVIEDCIEKLYEVTPQTVDEKLDMVFVNALRELKEQK